VSSVKLFVLSWLVWDAVAIGVRAGEATAVAAGLAVGALVAWWTRRVAPDARPTLAVCLACAAIVPADLCFILFDVTFWDRTSHNLAPLELIFSLFVGSGIIVGAAVLSRRVVPRAALGGGEVALALVCAILIGVGFWHVEPREPGEPRTPSPRGEASEAFPRLTADEVTTLLTSGTEVGRLVKPSGDWEGARGERYQARYDVSGRMTYTVEGREGRVLDWVVEPSGALCRGPAGERKCRVIERRGKQYAAVGHRSGRLRYEFTIEPGTTEPDAIEPDGASEGE